MAFHQLAPAGTPIQLRDFMRWIVALPRADEILETFRTEFRRGQNVRHCFFISSGRAGMYLLFRALRAMADPAQTEVIVPSFTCYSVPAAAIRAGLKVRVLDIDPDTLSYDIEQLSGTGFENVLAVVTANLFGIPNNLPALAALTRERGVFLLDDAAQSMGATINGRAVGTYGDVGLYSLDKGKNITSMQGGLIVTDSDEIAAQISYELQLLPPAASSYTLSLAIQMLVYGFFLRPWLYWIPANLPFLGLGATPFDIRYPVTRYPAALGVMAEQLYRRLGSVQAHRVAAAAVYRERLADLEHLQLLQLLPTASPAYARFPVVAKTPELRAQLLDRLGRAGLGASRSYPTSTLDIPEARNSTNLDASRADKGRSIASRVLTLPTHPYVDQIHLDQICTILSKGA